MTARKKITTGKTTPIAAKLEWTNQRDSLTLPGGESKMVPIPYSVYLIVADAGDEIGLVKVGITRKIKERLRILQTASPFKLSVLHTFDFPDRQIATEVESCFHATQADRQACGEWFRIKPSEALFLLAMSIEVLLERNVGCNGVRFVEVCSNIVGVDAAYRKLSPQGISPP